MASYVCTSVLLLAACAFLSAVTVSAEELPYKDFDDFDARRVLKTAAPMTFSCSKAINYTIDDIQTMYFTGALTPSILVDCYLLRIQMYSDPLRYSKSLTSYPLNAVIQINPTIVKDAAKATTTYKMRCKKATAPACLGPMYGIPVALKDNVAADGMYATAGSYALLGCSHKEATLATKIKAAGGLILAKAGLSEWANYRGSSVSGWSGRNGQVADPYVHYQLQNISVQPTPYPTIPTALANGTYLNALNPGIVSGSSSGSAVMAAVALATVTIGSETSGSILSPSSANALVGIKPTVGLVSRYGVVPLSHSQDTAGPICRTVRDAAHLLDTVYGVDTGDEDTITQLFTATTGGSTGGYYAATTTTPSFKGFTLAAAPLSPATNPKILAAYNAALATMASLGATVDIYPFYSQSPFNTTAVSVSTGLILPTDFKQDIATYMAGCTWTNGFTPLYTLADLIQFNIDNYVLEFQGGACCRGIPAYGNFFQQTWVQAQATINLYDPLYLAQKAAAANVASYLASFFAGNNTYNRTYDAVIHQGGFIGLWATTRQPSITVPLTTNTLGAPGGIIFSGLPYTEAKLVKIAYAYEQLINKGTRPQPTFCNSYTC